MTEKPHTITEQIYGHTAIRHFTHVYLYWPTGVCGSLIWLCELTSYWVPTVRLN